MIEAPALAVRGLSVRLGDRPVLHRVSLSAGRGELVALAGPNGSGKTTLLRAALGLAPIAAGTVELFGTPTVDLSVRERARRVAWVPQEESARDNVGLREYILYGRYPHLAPFEGESRTDRELADRALADVGLLDRADDGIRSLSGGERQRLLLGRALAQGSPLLLLDEPTAHLDIGHQLDILERVHRLVRERGVCAVAALHDLNLAARYADRLVVLSHGRLVADGSPKEVLDPPLLRDVWGVEAILKSDPHTGQPYLLPRRTTESSRATPAPPGTRGPVHVVGGGGAASPILRRLVDDGWAVTTGALPLLDSDTETAEELGLPFVAEIPFSPLSDEVRERHRRMLDGATAIVVAPFAVGPTNLANLEDLVGYAGRCPVVLIEDGGIARRDFTHGEATALWARLKVEGATVVPDVDGALRRLGELPTRSA
ncbi:MAG TPA: ABC transporter ATP-binding protein [Thermoplasmata archaeon]